MLNRSFFMYLRNQSVVDGFHDIVIGTIIIHHKPSCKTSI